jgi:hypothetical protein
VSPATKAPLSRTVSLTRADYARGSVRELHATVRFATGSVVRLTAAASGLNASKDFTIPAGTWVDIRTFLTIPKTGADTAPFNHPRVSGGTFSARQINAYSA